MVTDSDGRRRAKCNYCGATWRDLAATCQIPECAKLRNEHMGPRMAAVQEYMRQHMPADGLFPKQETVRVWAKGQVVQKKMPTPKATQDATSTQPHVVPKAQDVSSSSTQPSVVPKGTKGAPSSPTQPMSPKAKAHPIPLPTRPRVVAPPTEDELRTIAAMATEQVTRPRWFTGISKALQRDAQGVLIGAGASSSTPPTLQQSLQDESVAGMLTSMKLKRKDEKRAKGDDDAYKEERKDYGDKREKR